MIKFVRYLCLFLTVIALTSCFRSRRNKENVSIPFSIKSSSPLFSEKYFSLRIDSGNNYLKISLIPEKGIENFPFTKDKDRAALTATAFSFSLCINGSCIQSADLPSRRRPYTYFGYNSWLEKDLALTSDTFDLLRRHPVTFKIPFYAFHKLKRGTNEIELRCRQDIFCSPSTFTKLDIHPVTGDSSYRSIRNYSRASLIAFSADFKINIPQIFKTAIYEYGIELRNDSVYSPAGMDNTIWNSSYPDVYWTISYPDNEFFCSSDFQKSTGFYDLKDTFYLYHYTPNDSITIGVWDHDNLSRDDYIANQRFSLNQFPQNNTVKLAFGNVKVFECKMVKGFAVNQ